MRRPIYMQMLVLMFVLLVCPSYLSAAGQQTDSKKKSSSPPISISADQMEANDKQSLITFTGNVVARQDDMILGCDLMRVYYASGEGTSDKADSADSGKTDDGTPVLGGRESQIKRIEAEGNVKITRGDQVAQAQKAVYYAKSTPRSIILTGEPRVWRDKDFLTGSKITYYLDESRSLVEGGPKKRVNAIFYQESDESKDSKE